MAIYHFSVQIIGRSAGRSAVAAAAYRSSTKIVNQYDGVTHDYTRKNWVEHTEILLPENAPAEFKDRAVLWNAVEKIEKSSNAQLCRELEIALPRELSMEDNTHLLTEFVHENFVSEGMCADIAVHNPPVMDDLHRPITDEGIPTHVRSKMSFLNPHAHVLLTLRPIDANGRWEPKTSKLYVCKCGTEIKEMTGEEFSIAKEEGWEKQYRYYTPEGKKVWLTPSEALPEGLSRVNRAPRTAPLGRRNPKVEHWSSKDRVKEWREKWAEYVNCELRKHGIEETIDHRSFLDQGREFELPTIHLGPSAAAMERRAKREEQTGSVEVVHSDIAEINQEIRKHNQLVRDLVYQLDKEIAKIRQDEKEQAEQQRKIFELQKNLQNALLRRDKLEQERTRISSDIEAKNNYIEEIKNDIRTIEAAIDAKVARINELKTDLNSAKTKRQRKLLREAIASEQETLDTIQNYLKSQKQHYNINDDNLLFNQDELDKMKEEADNLTEQIEVENVVIEETSEMIHAIDTGAEIGSEAMTMAAHGAVEIVRNYKNQQRKSENKRRR